MKKKTEKLARATIHCKEYRGYIDEMPEEAKADLLKRSPRSEILFKTKTN